MRIDKAAACVTAAGLMLVAAGCGSETVSPEVSSPPVAESHSGFAVTCTETIRVGQVGQCEAYVPNASGPSQVLLGVAWSSSNPSVATVDFGGAVTGVSAGLAQIQATYNGATESDAVRVIR